MKQARVLTATLLLSLLLYRPVVAQTTWEAYRLDSQLAVRFPKAPEELDLPRTAAAHGTQTPDTRMRNTRAFRTEDAVAYYVVLSIPFQDSQYFSQPVAAREAYCKSHSVGLLMQEARGELLEQTFDFQPGRDSFTLKFRTLTADGTPGIKYLRMLTIGQRIHQLYFTPRDKTGKGGAAQRATFFATLTPPPGN